MLLEADKYDGGTLPDVSQSVTLPSGIASISGAAGLRSGTDYAAAIRAMAYKPLTPIAPRARDMSHLDEPLPTPDEQRLEKARMERKHVSALVRQSANGGYTEPPVPDSTLLPLPGDEPSLFPNANSEEPGNILLNPNLPLTTPPAPKLFDDEDDLLKSIY